MTSRLALAAALTFALAACGGESEPDETAAPVGEASEAAAPAPATTDTAAPDEAATPAMDVSETGTPSPTPTATRATASPTPVAAAGPPESFKQCAICHKTEPGQHGLGPSLAGVFGARAAHASGFAYSDAMKAANLTWNQATLGRYLADPQAVVPGTTMAFAGVKDPATRAELIAFLRTL